ncbi:MAG: 16S rRNA (cytidine(1402)-2'-O)-methyltransferase [Chlamydiota bacterium]
MLYIVATPIGNLEDITLRALKVLQSCDYILAEDTRKSSFLLQHYNIKKPCKSFHKFSEKKQLFSLVEDLENQKNIALISDAGTPLICDPGLSLIQVCIEKNLPFTSIPGPSSVIQALVLSGLATLPFQFVGFLPKKNQEKTKFLQKMLFYSGTSIAFETSKRLLDTLSILKNLDPQKKIVVTRELTKIFEQHIQASSTELFDYFTKNPPKGEIVLLFEGQEFSSSIDENQLFSLLQEHGLSQKEALKILASYKKISKNDLYKKILIKQSTTLP